jgi:GTP pyrophosphokinase
MVPLRTRLQNGDIVAITTQSGHKPSRDWLTFVVTSRARSKIKHVLQSEERSRSIELGRRLFEKEARRFDLNPKTVLESEELAKFATEYGAQKPDELLAHIGYGKLSARTVLQKSVPGGQLKERPADSGVVSVVKRVLRPGAASDKIKVRGTDDIMVFRAKCCNPIRGEKIVGYITRGKGVSVHAATCPNVLNLMFDPERRIDVEWDATTSDQAGGRSERHAGRDQRQGVGHQYEHHQHGSPHRRRSTGAHRHDGRDQRCETPRARHQVNQGCSGSLGRRADRESLGSVGRVFRAALHQSITAMTSISTRASRGSRATCTVERAGGGSTT